MGRVVSRDEAKAVIEALRRRQPRTLDDLTEELGKREFDVRKVLGGLEGEGIIIRESMDGVEKYWLNDNMAVDFLGRDPRQRRRFKHTGSRRPAGKGSDDDPAYC